MGSMCVCVPVHMHKHKEMMEICLWHLTACHLVDDSSHFILVSCPKATHTPIFSLDYRRCPLCALWGTILFPPLLTSSLLGGNGYEWVNKIKKTTYYCFSKPLSFLGNIMPVFLLLLPVSKSPYGRNGENINLGQHSSPCSTPPHPHSCPPAVDLAS